MRLQPALAQPVLGGAAIQLASMSESFWDYIIKRRQPGANSFVDFIRLIRRGTIARPREVEGLLELKALL